MIKAKNPLATAAIASYGVTGLLDNLYYQSLNWIGREGRQKIQHIFAKYRDSKGRYPSSQLEHYLKKSLRQINRGRM